MRCSQQLGKHTGRVARPVAGHKILDVDEGGSASLSFKPVLRHVPVKSATAAAVPAVATTAKAAAVVAVVVPGFAAQPMSQVGHAAADAVLQLIGALKAEDEGVRAAVSKALGTLCRT